MRSAFLFDLSRAVNVNGVRRGCSGAADNAKVVLDSGYPFLREAVQIYQAAASHLP
jgi:hypothetical protein